MGFQYPGPEVTITSIHISLSRTAHGAVAKGKGLRNAVLCALEGKESQKLISASASHRTRRGRQSSWQSLTDGEIRKRTQDVRRASQSRCILRLSSLSPIDPTAKNAKLGPRRGKESFLSSSDFIVLITLLPSSARGMSTDQNYLKNSKRNLALRL